jgi:hypothetical protein
MANRKKRTREHIIADLCTNYVEYFVIVNGFSVERVEKDYGYDLIMFTYDNHGEIENGQVYLQLKATDNISIVDNTITFSVSIKDLNLWIKEPMPVFIILYDVSQKVAFWLYVQAYYEKHQDEMNFKQKTITLRFAASDILNENTIRKFRDYKINILKQFNGKAQHHV